MWFLMVFGALSLICGARFALRPEPARLRMAGAMSLATLFTTLTGVCTDLATVGHQVPIFMAHNSSDLLPSLLLQGFAESMSPAILGFTVLTLAALFIALGCHRESIDA